MDNGEHKMTLIKDLQAGDTFTLNGLQHMKHKFVEFIPSELEDDVLYISKEYKTATHLCACGCGNKVITPLTPEGWTFDFINDTVSLSPSIGNFRFPCKSHYFIKNSQVEWVGKHIKQPFISGFEIEV